MENMRFRGNKPERQHSTDAGADLACKEDFYLAPGSNLLVDTGTAVDIPDGFVGLVVSRSGLGSRGIRIRNGVGVIDPSYKSNIQARMENVSLHGEHFSAGDRIAQLLIVPVETPKFVKGRGAWPQEGRGGFGSTGISSRE